VCADGEAVVDACCLGDDFTENDDEGGGEDDGGPSSAEDTIKHNRKRLIYNHVAINKIQVRKRGNCDGGGMAIRGT
jgi:hypothetical protein